MFIIWFGAALNDQNYIQPFLTTWFPCSKRTGDPASSNSFLPCNPLEATPLQRDRGNCYVLCVTCIFCCHSIHKFKSNHIMQFWPWTIIIIIIIIFGDCSFLTQEFRWEILKQQKQNRNENFTNPFLDLFVSVRYFLPLFICRFSFPFFWNFKNWNKRV